ncbi:hypothetical protein HRG_001790 [Hirsutella rhossiliensis]|uniref:Uncharacterized protein n=1 Tax=Hirsutella rhossiliensis TaxID=111463 RepID=A0A9P8SMQ4_9HYPO|nr:uncharacterized protein HRG_01790 [Hirsutella rhossiliensis]KAH0966381.1 hypothetical protein HRG_01790 [Hirsutella rhossiliensis]
MKLLAAVAMGLWALAAAEFDGFHIDPSLPDGHYSIHLKEDGNHHVRRWTSHKKRWQRLQKRQGTHEYTWLVDDETNKVEGLALDSFAKQRVPVPPMRVSCIHLREYNTLNYPLPADDYRASKQALFNYCNIFNFIEGHIAMALNGTVAVYVCQRKVTIIHENVCAEAEYKAVEARLNQSCGDASAYGFIGDWNKEYGRNWRGEKVCRRWGKKVYNSPANFNFENLPGNGALTSEPFGDRPEKSKEQFLKETVFEPLKGDDYDDGVRDNYGSMYGQYADGWANNHNWREPRVGEPESP